MGDNPQLEIEIILPDGTVKKAFGAIKQEAQKTAGDTSKELEKPFLNMASAAKLAATAVAAYYTSQKLINAANVQEEAINDFNTSLKLSGQYSKEASQDYQDFASQLQRNSVVGDEVILKNAALIQNLGKLSKDGLKEATQAALDMSAALGIDLASAATLVGKAATGEVGSFSRYGLTIEKAATSGETFKNVLNKINDSFGGAAAAKITTYKGANDQLSNSFGDMVEELGFVITTAPGAVGSIGDINKNVNILTDSIKKNREKIQEWIKTILEFPIAATDKILKFLDGGESVSRSSQIAVVTAELNKQKQILESYNNTASDTDDTFTRLEKGVLGFFGLETENKINENIDSTKVRITELEKQLKDLSSVEITTGSVKPLDTGLQNKIPENKLAIPDLSREDFGKGFFAGFNSETKKTKKSVEDLKKDFVTFGKTTKDVMINGFGAGVANGFASVGKALVEGDNALEAFGKAFIGSIGQMLIQEGTAFILKGIAYSSNPLTPGIGGPMIAAGSAMAIAGGAMSALAGGGASSTGNSSGASAVTYADTGTTTELQEYDTKEREERRSNVNVTVNGFIGSDKDELALGIANLLKDAGLNGVTA